MTAWEGVRGRIAAGDAEGTAAHVTGLSPEERRTVAKELPGYLRACRRAAGLDWPDGSSQCRKVADALRVAGAACMGGAAATADWISRSDLLEFSPDAGAHDRLALMVKVMADRPAEWRVDVARRISARLRLTPLPNVLAWQVAAELVRGAGAEPPADDVFLICWLRFGADPDGVAHDPFLDPLLPRLFEVDGVGELLYWSGGPAWAGPLVALAGSGRLKREVLLEGCVSRLLRGGPLSDLRGFVKLHDALEPSAEETSARVRDYVRLLPTAPGPVAELALREVRRADEMGAVDQPLLAEAAEALLFRTEKKLVRATLTWLDRTARTRDRVDATLTALTVAFGHEAVDLRERAVKVAAKHGAKGGSAARDTIREAAAPLAADLRELLAPAVGTVAAEPADVAAQAPVLLPPTPPAPRELPPPIASAAELIEEFAGQLGREHVDWIAAERVLAGLVDLGGRKPDEVRSALDRIVPEVAPSLRFEGEGEFSDYPGNWLGEAARPLVTPAPDPRAERWFSVNSRHPKPAPHRALVARMQEIPRLVGQQPVLLATPTTATGHLDPDVLIARLERIEEAGVEPGPLDLDQALLRLPRLRDGGPDVIGPAVAERAGRLRSPAGQRVASWLADGGMPDPVVTCAEYDLTENTRLFYPSGPDARCVLPTVHAPEARHGMAALLCGLGDGDRPDGTDPFFFDTGGTRDWWPALMPSHREVIAAHLMLSLPFGIEALSGQGAVLLALAETDGPPGVATATALAFGMGAKRQEERAGVIDALLVLAARRQTPAAELGTAIGTLVRLDYIKLNRATGALTEAIRAGAHAELLPALAAAVRALLPEPGQKAPAGLADLMALTTETAETLWVSPDIPELAAFAARGGSSRIAKEASRLHRQMI